MFTIFTEPNFKANQVITTKNGTACSRTVDKQKSSDYTEMMKSLHQAIKNVSFAESEREREK